MKSIKLFCRLLAVAFLLLPVAAKAEGVYVIGAIGPADEFAGDTDSSFGHLLAVGKGFGDSFAVELFHANPASSTGVDASDDPDATDLTTIGLAVKWNRDFSDSLKGFVKVGYHSWDIEYNGATFDDGTDFVWGLGTEYKFSDNLGLIVGYDSYSIDVFSSANYLHFGVKYSF